MFKYLQTMNDLLTNIHDLVDKMVSSYVKEYLHKEISKISSKYDIPHDDIMACLNLKQSTYQNTICKARTTLGNPCKYKTHNGDEYCLKHKKLLSKENA